MQTFDAIVVGAGPAGSATAALLAERGLNVALVDRASFPRPKPCAEYLSPETSRILERFGLTHQINNEAPARLHGMRIISPNGSDFTGRFAGAHDFRGYSNYGLALPREVLDNHLLETAVRRGAKLMDRATACALTNAESGKRKLVLRGGRGTTQIAARIVIGADGLNSRIAQALGVRRKGRLRRFALVAHAVDVVGMTDVGEMHVRADGYVGLATLGRGITTVAAVVDRARRSVPKPTETNFRQLLMAYPEVWERIRHASFVTPVRAVGPFARTTTRATADGALLVGDAADFYDPFTGEGIYAALRGAELAAAQVTEALDQGGTRANDLAPYDAQRYREFGGKWIVERIISWVVGRPRVLDFAVKRLSQRRELADLLVGVTGDFIPTKQVLRPSYVWNLIR